MTGLSAELLLEGARNRVAVSNFVEEDSTYLVQVGPGFFSSPEGKHAYIFLASVEVIHKELQDYTQMHERLVRLAVAVAVIYCHKGIGEKDPKVMVSHLWKRWREGIINTGDKEREKALTELITVLLKMGMHPLDLDVLPSTFGYAFQMGEGKKKKVRLSLTEGMTR